MKKIVILLTLLIPLVDSMAQHTGSQANYAPDPRASYVVSDWLGKGLWQGKGRIIIGSDGNEHDNDDWAATPLSAAILASQGLQDRVVAYIYSNHIWHSNHYYSNAYDVMKEGAEGIRDWFGYDPEISKFFAAIDDPELAYNTVRDAVLESSADNPLFLMAGGPMQVEGEGLSRAAAIDNSKLQYCTLISHSDWNDTHSDNPESWESPKHSGWTLTKIRNACTNASMPGGGLKYAMILNQNGVNGNGTGWYLAIKADKSYFTWVQNSPEKDKAPYYKTGSWDYLWSRMQLYINSRGSLFDASDAGMPLWFVTGIEATSPQLLRSVMENPQPRVSAMPTSIKNPQADLFEIRQDPVTGDIRINASEAPKRLSLYNITGQKIAEVYKTATFYTASLPKGSYILKIETNTGKSESYKFIKK